MAKASTMSALRGAIKPATDTPSEASATKATAALRSIRDDITADSRPSKARTRGQIAEPASRAPSREGKAHISAWLNPSFRASIRMIQVQDTGKSQQDLIAEALNLLFGKYNVPTVRYPDED